MAKHHETGRIGEHLACEYLEALGYHTVERNWRCQYGELDLVMRDGETIIFCEVKTRRNSEANALSAVSERKRERLTRSAQFYADQHGVELWRIDGISVILGQDGEHQIEYVEDALDW